MSGIIDFRTPAAGFDQPIEMWLACHERMLRMIALLVRLCEHLSAGGASESAGVTAASILRYFNEAAPRHHEDEEVDLFPRLQARLKGAERGKIAATIYLLTEEHQVLNDAWAQLRPTLMAIESGADKRLDDDATRQFVKRYRQHVEHENEVLAPVFRRAFDEAELEAIGRSMAARRGVNWEELRALK
jgi:hemerythrin-like domain-containing protein